MTETDSIISSEERKGAFDLVAEDGDAGRRLDFFIAVHIPNCSRTRAADLVKQGFVRVNNELKKQAYRIAQGDRIHGEIPAPREWTYSPEPMPLNVLFEDEHIIVVNKPPGMVVHPSAGHHTGTLAQALLYHCPGIQGIGGAVRPGIVHRLDKDTSGTIVAAKTQAAQEHLSLQFKRRIPEKTYLALVVGHIPEVTGEIHLPIGRHPQDRKKMSTIGKRVRIAETHWAVQERIGPFTLLSLRIKTGRTHQIRVHCKAIHHPVVGDPVYGNRRGIDPTFFGPDIIRLLKTINRQMLHAWRLCIRHPVTESWCCFESPMPEDMTALLQVLRETTGYRDAADA